jgi:isochorismate hydrolase
LFFLSFDCPTSSLASTDFCALIPFQQSVTHICVLTTVLDAICHDFKAVLLEDCTAAFSKQIHERTLDNYRRNALYPLLRVAKSTDQVSELLGKSYKKKS